MKISFNLIIVIVIFVCLSLVLCIGPSSPLVLLVVVLVRAVLPTPSLRIIHHIKVFFIFGLVCQVAVLVSTKP
jgi:hypothetical protein